MEERFEELFQLYSSDVYRLAYSYVLNGCDAEDIVQRTFYKLYKNSKHMNLRNDDVKRWLFRVSINESKNVLKSSWRKRIKSIGDDDSVSSNIEKTKNLLEMLSKVSKDYRITLYLYYYEGYSIEEISKIVHKSVSAIKMRLSRGREQLRKEMEVNE